MMVDILKVSLLSIADFFKPVTDKVFNLSKLLKTTQYLSTLNIS